MLMKLINFRKFSVLIYSILFILQTKKIYSVEARALHASWYSIIGPRVIIDLILFTQPNAKLGNPFDHLDCERQYTGKNLVYNSVIDNDNFVCYKSCLFFFAYLIRKVSVSFWILKVIYQNMLEQRKQLVDKEITIS